MRVAERLRMRTHSRPAGVVTRATDNASCRSTGNERLRPLGRPPGPRRVRARVLRRTTPGCLAPVARMLACVIVALSVTHPRLRGGSGSRCVRRLASAASPTRVEAAGEHETCQCERCGLCRWYQLPFAAPETPRLWQALPDAILRAAVADQGVAVGHVVRTTRPRSARSVPQLGSAANVTNT